jgi:hypothetical protein
MPIYLQVLYVALVPALVSIAWWIIREVLFMRVKIVQLEGEISAIQPRCAEHEKAMEKMWGKLDDFQESAARRERNIVRIGIAVKADGLENG